MIFKAYQNLFPSFSPHYFVHPPALYILNVMTTLDCSMMEYFIFAGIMIYDDVALFSVKVPYGFETVGLIYSVLHNPCSFKTFYYVMFSLLILLRYTVCFIIPVRSFQLYILSRIFLSYHDMSSEVRCWTMVQV